MCVFWGVLNTFFIPPPNCKTESAKFHEILTGVCVGGSKNIFYTPQNCKTESAKFHEILTSVCVEGSKKLYTPQIVKLKVPNSMKKN